MPAHQNGMTQVWTGPVGADLASEERTDGQDHMVAVGVAGDGRGIGRFFMVTFVRVGRLRVTPGRTQKVRVWPSG
jgi:hypothetical protein